VPPLPATEEEAAGLRRALGRAEAELEGARSEEEAARKEASASVSDTAELRRRLRQAEVELGVAREEASAAEESAASGAASSSAKTVARAFSRSGSALTAGAEWAEGREREEGERATTSPQAEWPSGSSEEACVRKLRSELESRTQEAAVAPDSSRHADEQVSRLKEELAAMAKELESARASVGHCEGVGPPTPTSLDHQGPARAALKFVAFLGAASSAAAAGGSGEHGGDGNEDGTEHVVSQPTSPADMASRAVSSSGGSPMAASAPAPATLPPGDGDEMKAAAIDGHRPRSDAVHQGYIQKRTASSLFGRRHTRYLVLWDHSVEWFHDDKNLDTPSGSLDLTRDAELKVSGKVISLSSKNRYLVFTPEVRGGDGGSGGSGSGGGGGGGGARPVSPTSSGGGAGRASEVQAVQGWVAAISARLDVLHASQRGGRDVRAQTVTAEIVSRGSLR